LFKKTLTLVEQFEKFAPHTVNTNYNKMRTKILLLTAAASAVGIASSMGQAVFSVNAVGFVKKTIPGGFSIIANPLNNTASNGNTVSNLFPNVPDGTTLYTFGTNGFAINSAAVIPPAGPIWDSPNDTLLPGTGVFILNPGTTPFDVVFVGEVMQGTTPPLSNPLPQGFSLKASQVPQSAPLNDKDTNPNNDLGFPAADGDTVYLFRNNNYVINSFIGAPVNAWDTTDGTAPVPDVGEGFFVNKLAAANWTRSFSVNSQ
jgi:hypothetical protein